jgi:hypothetical protein
MKISLFILLTMLLSGCATIRLKYDVDVKVTANTNDKTAANGKVTFEKSYPIDNQKILCMISGVLYGGACWFYLGMPNSEQMAAIKRDGKLRIQEYFEGKRLEYVSSEVSRVSWDDEAERLQISPEFSGIQGNSGAKGIKSSEGRVDTAGSKVPDSDETSIPDISDRFVRKKIAAVRVIEEAQLKQLQYKIGDSVKGVSCKRNAFQSEDASEEIARNKLKIDAYEKGYNGVINVSCTEKRSDLRTNCHHIFLCYGDGIEITPQKTEQTQQQNVK